MQCFGSGGRWVVVCAGLAVACGGETTGGSCGTPGDCGGDITGKWNVVSACSHANGTQQVSPSFPAECRQANAESTNSQRVNPVDAAIEFDAQGMYHQSGAMHISSSFHYDAACLHAIDSTGTADETCANLKKGIEVQFSTVSCTVSNGGCGCAVDGDVPYTHEGTYSTNGGQITLQDVTSPATYCVQGNGATITIDEEGFSGTLELAR